MDLKLGVLREEYPMLVLTSRGYQILDAIQADQGAQSG
jgi:hypothetical protein